MLEGLHELLRQWLPGNPDHTPDRDHTLELCAAVLMMEIAVADAGLDQAELTVIESAFREHFHLHEEEIASLIDRARTEVDNATSLFDFTRVVNDALERAEKCTLIELLWRVAVADQVLDKYEEYFIRKIADLLHVSHADYIRTKHRALN